MTETLTHLKRWMREHEFAAMIVTGTDPHESEYLPAAWKLREALTGFSGSAGTVAVTLDEAGLWTDGRYHLQAEQELENSGVALFKEGLSSTQTVFDWLKTRVKPEEKVAVDSWTTSFSKFERWKKEAETLAFECVEVPWTELWPQRPEFPKSEIYDYQTLVEITPRSTKLTQVRAETAKSGCQAVLLTTLDDIAWTLNLRGSDIPYNPVFLAWLLVEDASATLFVDETKIDSKLRSALQKDGVSCRDYSTLASKLSKRPKSQRILLNADRTNVALVQSVADTKGRSIVWGPAPTVLMKARKTPQEISLIKKAHEKDAVALVEFLAWFEETLGKEPLTEASAAAKLEEFRRGQGGYQGPSFAPIAGFKEHGAIIHYDLGTSEGSPLIGNGLFLLDTGGQYREGTTDVTRTISVGEPTAEERFDYTMVLKAHIQVALTPFPRGTRGYSIDAIARRVLWQNLRNYNHGTGHGVGQFLCVHEGPQRLNSEPLPTVLEPGMLLSNEPGIYRPQRWGIRLENLVLVTPWETTPFGEFLGWETLTLCPFEKKLIERHLLDLSELAWLERYHQTCRDRLFAKLSLRAQKWLDRATKLH